jgi:hypothetical protein
MILEDTAYIRPASLHVAVQSSEPVLAAALTRVPLLVATCPCSSKSAAW